jgi:hypothetical protein
MDQSQKAQSLHYLKLEPIPIKSDPLLWWKNNESVYPTFSKMAKDILAIPGSNVPSERTNSIARNVIDFSRSKLSKEAVEALVVSKCFLTPNKNNFMDINLEVSEFEESDDD